MKCKYLLYVVCLAVLSPAVLLAQDSGVRDTLRFEGGPIVTGQSRPIHVHVVNDFELRTIGLTLKLESVDGGFAQLDSAVYRGRMEDPSVLDFRIQTFNLNDGVHPDTFNMGFYNFGGQDLPTGNEAIVDFYFTGLVVGQVHLDTLTIMNGIATKFIETGTYPGHSPEIVPLTVSIEEGTQAPVLSMPDNPDPLAIGGVLDLEVSAHSPDNIPLTLDMLSFTLFDDSITTPTNAPLFTSSIPGQLHWEPTSSDVGIWRAVFEVCDSLAGCNSGELVIQVVESEQFLLSFEVTGTPDLAQARSILHGDYDEDQMPEVLAGGFSFQDYPDLAVYEWNEGGSLAEGFSLINGYGADCVQQGYFNNDNFLDLVFQSFRRVEIYHGQGDNTFVMANNEEVADVSGQRSSTLLNINGDQFNDYVLASASGVALYLGTGNERFFTMTDVLDVSGTAVSVNSADFDSDGLDDLAVGTASGLNVYLNDGTGGYVLANTYSQTYGSLDIEVTNQGSDFNDDGYYDLCLATPSVGGTGSEIVVYLGDGYGSFSQTPIRSLLGHVLANCAGDFNGDGHLDIAYINGSRKYVGLLFGSGDGNFANELRYELPGLTPRQMDCLDIDLDGDLDLLVSAHDLWAGSTLWSLENTLDPDGFARRSVRVYATDNAVLELESSSGRRLNSIASSVPSGSYHVRDLNQNSSADDMVAADVVETGAYWLNVAPKPNLEVGSDFSLEFTLEGERFRLVDSATMPADGYRFRFYPHATSEIVPNPGKFTYNPQPIFIWPGEGEFDFQLASNIDFTNLVETESVSGSTYTLANALEITDTALFYWRVKPIGDPEFGEFFAFNLNPGGTSLGDLTGDGVADIEDMTFLINYMFLLGHPPQPLDAADFDQSGTVDIADLTLFIVFLFFGGSL